MLLLELIRRHQGYSQTSLSLATKAKVATREISNLERGLRPTPKQVKALGAVFGMSEADAVWLFKPIEALGLHSPAAVPPPPSMREAILRGRQ